MQGCRGSISSMFSWRMTALRGHEVLKEIATAQLGRSVATERFFQTTNERRDTALLPLITCESAHLRRRFGPRNSTITDCYLIRWA